MTNIRKVVFALTILSATLPVGCSVAHADGGQGCPYISCDDCASEDGSWSCAQQCWITNTPSGTNLPEAQSCTSYDCNGNIIGNSVRSCMCAC